MPPIVWCIACDDWVAPGGHMCGNVRALCFCGCCFTTHEPPCGDPMRPDLKAKIRAAFATGAVLRGDKGEIVFRMAQGDEEILEGLGIKR